MGTVTTDFAKVWENFLLGDEGSFGLLFEEYFESMYRYGVKFVSDEEIVKDCIQDLFIKIYHNRASLSNCSNPKFYLLLALKNKIIDEVTKKRHLRYVAPEDLTFIAKYNYKDDESLEPEETEKRKKIFDTVLGLLNPRQKEAIYLRFQMNLSYDEISEIMGINYQSARNLVHRSIITLREKLKISAFYTVSLML